ncbi:MAG: DMT family transporter [Promethearchaeota archaeon]
MARCYDLDMPGELIAILATLTFVLSNIIFRKTEHDTSPIFINTFRTLIGVLTFILIAWVSGVLYLIFQLSWQIWLWLILSFVFGQVLGDTSYFMAQKTLGTTKAMAISMIYPIIAFVLSIIFLDEIFRWIIVVSFLFIMAGVLIIAQSQIKEEKINFQYRQQEREEGKKEQEDIHKSRTIGAVALALLASFGWAAGLVIIDYATKEIEAQLHIGAMSSVIGNVIRFPAAFFILSIMLYSTEKKPAKKLSKTSFLWLMAGALIGTALGAFLYTEAARVAGATVMSLIASASPLFSVPLTYLINHEKISASSIFGVISIMIGVIIIFL